MKFFALLLVTIGVLYGVAHGEEPKTHYVLALEINQIVHHKYPFKYEKGFCQMILWDFHFLPKIMDWRTMGSLNIEEEGSNHIVFRDYNNLYKIYFLTSFRTLSLKDREIENRKIFAIENRRKLKRQ